MVVFSWLNIFGPVPAGSAIRQETLLSSPGELLAIHIKALTRCCLISSRQQFIDDWRGGDPIGSMSVTARALSSSRTRSRACLSASRSRIISLSVANLNLQNSRNSLSSILSCRLSLSISSNWSRGDLDGSDGVNGGDRQVGGDRSLHDTDGLFSWWSFDPCWCKSFFLTSIFKCSIALFCSWKYKRNHEGYTKQCMQCVLASTLMCMRQLICVCMQTWCNVCRSSLAWNSPEVRSTVHRLS